MSLSKPLAPEEGVIIRDFIAKIGRDRIKELLVSGRPDSVTRQEIMSQDADSIARLASMHAGFDTAVEYFFELASVRRDYQIPSGHESMT